MAKRAKPRTAKGKKKKEKKATTSKGKTLVKTLGGGKAAQSDDPLLGTRASDTLLFMRTYMKECRAAGTAPLQGFVKSFTEHVEQGAWMKKCVLRGDIEKQAQPSLAAASATLLEEKQSTPVRSRRQIDEDDDDSDTDSDFSDEEPFPETEKQHKALLPLLNAVFHTHRENDINSIHVWKCSISEEETAMLVRLMNTDRCEGLQKLTVLDLMACTLSDWSVDTLARSSLLSNLTSLCLDYVRLGPACGASLCAGLEGNSRLKVLSLDFCGLPARCGAHFGRLLPSSAIRDLSLEGNTLQSQGVLAMLQPVVRSMQQYADYIAQRDAAWKKKMEEEKATATNSTKARGLQFGGAALTPIVASKDSSVEVSIPSDNFVFDYIDSSGEKIPPPLAAPLLERLILDGNSIDCCGTDVSAAKAMDEISMLVTLCQSLVELNLKGNDIGREAAAKLLEALEKRQEAGWKKIYVTVSHHIPIDLLKAIYKISAKKPSVKGKKKKKAASKKKRK